MEQPSKGAVHEITPEIITILKDNPDIQELWDNLTPLARNERICRTTIPKKQATKDKRLARLCEDIRAGHKRPCCRP
jgi:uncharacterized protein YdeI (YjbR/CyaY-like superfamily)